MRSITHDRSLTRLFPYSVVTNCLLLASCELLDLENGRNDGSLGLFQWQLPGEHSECVEVSDIQDHAVSKDAALNCARVCAVMALIFGAILFVFGFFKQCLFQLPCTQMLMDLSATCVQIMLALVYVVWATDACDEYYCSYGKGGTYLILTQIFWMAAGCFSRCMRDGRSERRKEDRASGKDEERKRQKEEDKKKKEEEKQKKADEKTEKEEHTKGGEDEEVEEEH
jgi:hypothetical protein